MTMPLSLGVETRATRARTSERLGWSLCAGLLVTLFLLANAPALLNDPDTQWHVAVGRWILANRAFPVADPFSHTFAGERWIAKEWGSQILLYAAYAGLGWTGVALLTALAAGLAATLLTLALTRSFGPLAAGLLAIVAIGLMSSTLLARPHLLVTPVMLAFAILVARHAEESRAPPASALLLMALWANLHASFAVGFVVAGAFALDAVWRARADQRLALALGWGLFLAALVLASVATPYGLEALLMPFRVSSGVESIQYIAEWRPLALDGPGIAALIAALVLVAALLRGGWRAAPRLLLVLFLTAMMVRHWRFALLFALVAPVVAAQDLSSLLKAVAARLNLFRSGDPLATSALWRLVAPTLAAAVIVLAAVIAPAPPASKAPRAALAAAGDLARTGMVFNSYNFGGFLILNGVKTFIDGRTDQLFLGGFMDGYQKILAAGDARRLDALLVEHVADWALVETGSREAALLGRLGHWTKTHEDPAATVFVRMTPALAQSKSPS